MIPTENKVMKKLLVVMMVGISLSTSAVADEVACRLVSSALEMLGDSQMRTADFASEGKASLMCIQHDESKHALETVQNMYRRCMPYLRTLGTPESKQVMEVYAKAMADAESGMAELDRKMEAQCAQRTACPEDAQLLKDSIEYHVEEATRARRAGNTLWACTIINLTLESAAEELKGFANECMVQDSLDKVREIRGMMSNC